MSAARVLPLYLAAVLLGGALLAPWLWQATQALAGIYPGLAHAAGQPFHRYVNRCLLGLALLGLWPLVKALGIGSRREIGCFGPWWPGLAGGFALGSIALGTGTLLALAFGGREWVSPPDTAQWLRRLAEAALSAALVACLEELLFRGVLQGAIRRNAGFVATAAITSALYSWAHFFERPPQPAHVDNWTGLWTLGKMLRGFTDPSALVPGGSSLLVAGGILALARERTGSLAFSIGLHAGWVFWVKASGLVTSDLAGANHQLWGSRKMFDGWVPFALLALQAFVVHVALRPRPGPDPSDSHAHPDRH
jgi:hypothetical protein